MNRTRSLSTVCFGRSLSLCHVSRVARFLTQIGYRIALAAIPLFALGSAQLTEAQTTIQVTTTQQGVTDQPVLSARSDLCRGICEQHSVESD